MQLKSQEMRKLAPELDPLRIGTGWKPEDLSKPQIIIESTYWIFEEFIFLIIVKAKSIMNILIRTHNINSANQITI